MSETTSTAPHSLYAATKLGLYLILDPIGKVTSMSIAWLRFFYLYGPYEDKSRLEPTIICSLLNNHEARTTHGEQIRDILHIEDAASAVWAVIESNLSGPVNIGSGKPVAVRDIVIKIGTILGRPELIALGALAHNTSDPTFICANNRLLTNSTAWVPRYDLEEGLRHTVEWWKRHLKESYKF